MVWLWTLFDSQLTVAWDVNQVLTEYPSNANQMLIECQSIVHGVSFEGNERHSIADAFSRQDPM